MTDPKKEVMDCFWLLMRTIFVILCVAIIVLLLFDKQAHAAELSADKTAQSDQIPATPTPTPPPDESSAPAIVRHELRQLFALMERQAGEIDLPDTRVQARPGKTWRRGNYPIFH